jgi:hypothetical protein
MLENYSRKDNAMAMKSMQHKRQPRPLRDEVPWWTDVKAARQTALRNSKPCVIILNADSGAL